MWTKYFFRLTGVAVAVIIGSAWMTLYSQHVDISRPMTIYKVSAFRPATDHFLKGNLCSGNFLLTDLFRKYITNPKDKFAAIWVNGNGPLPERLAELNTVLENVREICLERASQCEWEAPGKLDLVLDGRNLSYLREVSGTGHVLQVMLSWIRHSDDRNTMNGGPNMLIKQYYQWVGSYTLCSLIKSGLTRLRYHVVFNNVCETDNSFSQKPRPLSIVYWNAQPASRKHKSLAFIYPSYFYTDPPPHVTFIMVAFNAMFTQFGDMYTKHIKMVSYGCTNNIVRNLPKNITNVVLYDEVFSISQKWGNAFYHKNIEDFPRLAPFLPFLLLHKNIKVHIFELGEYTERALNLLGISSDRLVHGDVRAKVAYMPECTYCGFAHPANSQLLSKIYRDIIREGSKKLLRDTVVLIRRSGRRKFVQHDEIKKRVQKISKEHGLIFKEFIDNPVPTLEETMQIFNRAVMVIGPHGGGFSNIIFSEPGTYIIETLCNRPHVQMCYTRLAHILGHRWHGVVSGNGCPDVVDVRATEVETIVRAYIKEATKLAVK